MPRLPGAAAALRIFSRRFVVEYPGASGIEITRPPAASTSSRPTTWSSGPVRAFDENAWEHARDQLARRWLIKNRHIIHRGKRGQNLGAILLRHQRTFGALVAANAAIAIDRDDQQIPEGARFRQTTHVARMQ